MTKKKNKNINDYLINLINMSVNNINIIKKTKYGMVEFNSILVKINDINCDVKFDLENNDIYQFPDINKITTVLSDLSSLFSKYSVELITLGLYDNWVCCCSDFFIFIHQTHESLLLKTINVDTNVSDILQEIYNCLINEQIFFKFKKNMYCSENVAYNKEIESSLVHATKHIVCLSNIIKKYITDKNCTMNELIDTRKLLENSQKEHNMCKHLPNIYKWNVIITKLRGFQNNACPFTLYDIRQIDKPVVIVKEIINYLCDDSNKYKILFENQNLFTYSYFILLNYNKKLCLLIDRANKILVLLNKENDTENDVKLLEELNEIIYDNYNSFIDYNSNLNINYLQNKYTSENYKQTFIFDIRWYDICKSITKYIYYKKAKIYNKFNQYTTLKCSLHSIIKNDDHKNNINKFVFDVNEIEIRTLFFIKCYTLYKYENNETLPNPTNFDFVSMSMRACCINDPKGQNMNDDNFKLLNELICFYDKVFKYNDIRLYETKCNAIGYSQILNSCKQQICTAYENNIKTNYLKYINNYMYSSMSREHTELIKDKESKKNLKKQISVAIRDLCKNNIKEMKCDEIFQIWILKNKNDIIPENISNDDELYYNLNNKPHMFLKCMIFMSCKLELMNAKMLNCFPLRTSLVPSSITLDTLSLITLFTINKNDDAQATSKLLKNNISVFYDKIWGVVFDLNNDKFKWNKNYKFNHTITTDGVEVSILMIHKKLDGIDRINNKKKDYFPYIDDLGYKLDTKKKEWSNELMKDEINKLIKNYKLVLVDPGKNPDLLYMCDYDENIKRYKHKKNNDDKENNNDNKEIKFFKYTTKQRLHEMKTIKDRKILSNFKKQNKEMLENEKYMSKYSSKTCNLNKFLEYISIKKEVNKILIKYYGMEFMRKMRLRGYINKMRSESKLVNNIKRIFNDNGKEIMLIYGDWSRKSQMRGVISTPMIGLKRRLQRDFKIKNFDEFRTSCLDNTTYKENDNAVIKTKSGKNKKLHSVLVSEIQDSGCKNLKRYQNRNRNAVLCFREIIKCYAEEGIRKKEFKRTDSSKCENVLETFGDV